MCLLLISLLSEVSTTKPVSGETENVWIPAANGLTEKEPQVVVETVSETSLRVRIQFSGVWAAPFSNEHGDFTQLFFDGYGEHGDLGAPNLPIFTTQLEIPHGVTPRVTVIDSKAKMVQLSAFSLPKTIVPTQPLQSKSGPVPQWQPPDAQIYAQYQLYPQQLFTASSVYQMRDHTILPLQITPVRYQPQSGELEILESLTLEIRWEGSAIRSERPGRSSLPFDRLAADLTVNAEGFDVQNTGGIGYLVISPSSAYTTILSPWLDLKENEGYQVTTATLDMVGNSAVEIRDYIKNAYENWIIPPTYVLLVGDTNLIPGWKSIDTRKVTDLYYATMTDDIVPDIFVGRLPARDLTDVTILVNKLIQYQGVDGSEVWVKKAAFAATADSNRSSSEDYDFNYQLAEASHNYVIDTYTNPSGYTGIFPTPVPSPGGDKLYRVTYGANQINLIEAIDDQRSIIVYSGHGSTSSWSEFYFNTTTIESLEENQVYSFAAGFACETNDISVEHAFGEAWMLTENKGGIAYLGSADYSYWGPDDVLERSFFDKFFESTDIPPSIAASMHHGLSFVQNYYPDYARYYWESYLLLGDPSLIIPTQTLVPNFAMQLVPNQVDLCMGVPQEYDLYLSAFQGFDDLVNLSTSDLPSGIHLTYENNPVSPGTSTTLSFTADINAVLGKSSFSLLGETEPLPLNLSVVDQLPSFPYLISPSNQVTTDTVFPTLTWEDVSQTQTYQLQLSKDSSFNTIDVEIDAINTSSYTFTTALESNSTYYWRVKSKNACGTSAFSNIRQFHTPTTPGDCPAGYEPQTIYAADFNQTSGNWTSSGNVWVRHSQNFMSPDYAFFVSGSPTTTTQRLESVEILIPQNALLPRLQFWSWYSIRQGVSDTCYDGALVEYKVSDQSIWNSFDPSQILENPYTGLISTDAYNPLNGKQAWCGDSAGWVKSVIDLNQHQGETLTFRFSLGTGSYSYFYPTQEGWYIDDVKVQTCTPLETIFLPVISH